MPTDSGLATLAGNNWLTPETQSRPLEFPIVPLPNWGVRGVAAALVTHENGIFSQSAPLAEQLLRNPRIRAALTTRVQSVTGLKKRFVPANASAKAKQIATLAETEWDSWCPPRELEALRRWRHLMGCGIAQLLWDRSDTLWRPRLNLWHPANLYWFWDFQKLFGCFIGAHGSPQGFDLTTLTEDLNAIAG